MVCTLAVGAFLALARGTAGDTGIEALAILLLALTFLAVAPLPAVLLLSARQLLLDELAGLAEGVGVVVVVMTAEAGALFGAGFARGEALAVHFEALCFFAGAAGFLLLDQRG
jgi:hypothetical protein